MNSLVHTTKFHWCVTRIIIEDSLSIKSTLSVNSYSTDFFFSYGYRIKYFHDHNDYEYFIYRIIYHKTICQKVRLKNVKKLINIPRWVSYTVTHYWFLGNIFALVLSTFSTYVYVTLDCFLGNTSALFLSTWFIYFFQFMFYA